MHMAALQLATQCTGVLFRQRQRFPLLMILYRTGSVRGSFDTGQDRGQLARQRTQLTASRRAGSTVYRHTAAPVVHTVQRGAHAVHNGAQDAAFRAGAVKAS